MLDGGVVVALVVGGALFALIAKAFARSGPQNELYESWVRYGQKHALRYIGPKMLLGHRMPMLASDDFRLDLAHRQPGIASR